ncbi:hypothetical protein [Streptomyces sp. bgisy034]|uniref:hypothetical protein n=1 Tax=Streptomyces sp. bgisy034 TaxID=3413774 RepID=UPI003EBBB289
MARSGKRTLRRRSWPILTWSGIALLWLMYPLGVQSSLEHGNRQDVWVVAAVLSAVTALCRRIGTCRVELLPDELAVHNFLFSHRARRGAVRRASAGGTGGLVIEVSEGREIHPFAFGGSVVDAWLKTSPRAAAEIVEWAQAGRVAAGPEDGQVRRSVRLCWSADLALLCAVVAAVVALVVGGG